LEHLVPVSKVKRIAGQTREIFAVRAPTGKERA